MGSNQSMPSSTSMPSIYCIYEDKCPSRNRSAICVPCLYKNKTGLTKPPTINRVNPNCIYSCAAKLGMPCSDCSAYFKQGVRNCKCEQLKLKSCGECYNYMKDYVFPPATSDDRLSLLKPYEADNNFAKF